MHLKYYTVGTVLPTHISRVPGSILGSPSRLYSFLMPSVPGIGRDPDQIKCLLKKRKFDENDFVI